MKKIIFALCWYCVCFGLCLCFYYCINEVAATNENLSLILTETTQIGLSVQCRQQAINLGIIIFPTMPMSLLWKFPEVSLGPEFLLVWLQAGQDPGVHTNFGLKQEGAPDIVRPPGNVVDRVDLWPAALAKLWRNPDGGKEWHRLSTPTGASNPGRRDGLDHSRPGPAVLPG